MLYVFKSSTASNVVPALRALLPVAFLCEVSSAVTRILYDPAKVDAIRRMCRITYLMTEYKKSGRFCLQEHKY